MTASAAANGSSILQEEVGSDTGTAAADQSGQEAQHYDAVAATYESAFFYSSIEYRDWVMGHLLHHFRLPDEVRHHGKVSSACLLLETGLLHFES